MSARQALASALHLFVVFAFFGAGLFFIGLPYLGKARLELIDLLTNRVEECTVIGFGFFIVSMLFLLGFYALDRGRYLVLQMGVSADVRVVRQTVEDLFAKQFPKKILLKEIGIGPKSSLELNVRIAPLDEFAREKLFAEVEKQLGLLLQKRFGYTKPFNLIVSI